MSELSNRDVHFMREAIAEGARAEARGEVPVGSIIVVGGEIVARGHNLRETAQDPTAHAELIAMRALAARQASWRLIDATVYVTLEPCPMCSGALVNARVPRVVWGADDPKAGAMKTLYTIGSDPRLNHEVECVSGVLEEECAEQLRAFFRKIRKKR